MDNRPRVVADKVASVHCGFRCASGYAADRSVVIMRSYRRILVMA
jgi:hypothetical protein